MGKVTGVKALQRNMGRIFKDINEKKAPQFVGAVLSIGLTHSKELAPLEFGTLVNSSVMDVDVNSFKGEVSGSVRYLANYAAALEFRTDWKPRPISEKAGPAWNPDAEPHFLRKGFEDASSRAAIKKAESIFKI
jgi:hypothetical protein